MTEVQKHIDVISSDIEKCMKMKNSECLQNVPDVETLITCKAKLLVLHQIKEFMTKSPEIQQPESTLSYLQILRDYVVAILVRKAAYNGFSGYLVGQVDKLYEIREWALYANHTLDWVLHEEVKIEEAPNK